jgi:hypothetical protein
MHLLTRIPSVQTASLLLAAVVSTSAPQPAVAQSIDTTRPLPSACAPAAADFANGLREADRRLDRTPDRPGADRMRSSILADTLADPRANATLADLLACLAKR